MSAAQSWAAILRVFAVLFSARWIGRWQRRQELAGAHRPKKKRGADSMNASSRCA
jgi:hypothetical protein